MAMLDDWGEEIQNVPDEGVFSETALGEDAKNFPNTNTRKFPYVPQPTKQIQQVAPNKYALLGSTPIEQATAGMGSLGTNGGWEAFGPSGGGWETTPLPGTEQPWVSAAGETPGWGTPSAAAGGGGRLSGGDIAGLVTSGFNSIMGAVGTGFQIYGGMETMRASRQQAASELSMQMQMFQHQLEQQTLNAEQEREYRALLMEAEMAQASDDPEAMLAVLTAMQAAQRPSVLPWVIGGVAVAGLIGVVIYMAAKGGK